MLQLRYFIGLAAYLIASSCTAAQTLLNAQPPLDYPIVAIGNDSVSCHHACALLQGVLGRSEGVITSLKEPREGYFSIQQQELVPTCIAQPQSAEEVSQIIHILKEQRCIFAVKSGGHSTCPGASAIHDGVVVDLGKLNSIQVSADESTVSVGSGSRWGDVYSTLEEYGLLAVGGRVDSVGVGGFILGGGISFLSRRHGWAFDNVRNFEVVLPNGTIANANQVTHPDLYFALRGGGNNFGIVTRFDLEAYRYGLLWGGTSAVTLEDLEERRSALGLRDKLQWTIPSIMMHLTKTIQRVACILGFGIKSTDMINAFVQMASNEQTDASAHMYTFLSWLPVQKVYLSGATIFYSRPEENPPVFRNFTSLKTIYSTNRLANMSDFTSEVEKQNPTGMRQLWRTATFKVDAYLISKLWDIFLSEVDYIKTIPGTLASSNLQLITNDEIEIFSKNGGNALGINKEDGPLFIFSVTIMYENASDDETMRQAGQNIISRGIALGKEMGLWHRFIYKNYAGFSQEVFASYGSDNQARLRDIQHKYDPEGVFQNIKQGCFKV